MDADLDVVGIGNALVDVLVETAPDVIAESGLAKGAMVLMDLSDAEEVHARVGSGVERSGGSAANTIAGLAALGARAGFVGKIAGDRLGRAFADDLAALGVVAGVSVAPSGATGRCLVLVTPDADRTMCTSLGVAAELHPTDVDHDLVSRAAVTYLEGYLFDPPEAKKAFRDAAATAHRSARRVALSLSDPFCVERHRRDFDSLVHSDVDLLFGNEDEALLLTGASSVGEAQRRIRRAGLVATITLGADGALVWRDEEEPVHVPAAAVERVVDTTGAGDLYAAGFLWGFVRGFALDECARAGAVAAAEAISHVGARPVADLAALVTAAEISSAGGS